MTHTAIPHLHEWSLTTGQCVHCDDYNPGVWAREVESDGRPMRDLPRHTRAPRIAPYVDGRTSVSKGI